MAPTEHSHL
uniref:Uncharacterized protein n=1 Tax=Anguilla anguilla TaxID=7936 RepID=A0A0E9QNC5_ANGAN